MLTKSILTQRIRKDKPLAEPMYVRKSLSHHQSHSSWLVSFTINCYRLWIGQWMIAKVLHQ